MRGLPIRLRLLSHGARLEYVCFGMCVCVGPPSLSMYFSLAYSQISEHAISIETEVGGVGVCVCVCVCVCV